MLAYFLHNSNILTNIAFETFSTHVIKDTMKTAIFLLGGYDLEMKTIAQLLSSYHKTFYDNQLIWNNAYLSTYNDILERYNDSDKYIIYGIELFEDDNSYKCDNYIRIDHHNDYVDRSSSLQQVADILSHTLTRYEQLVSINDCSYIPGMVEFGATQTEIEVIRQEDRNAQGVSAEDELAAERAIRENKIEYKGITIVQTSSSRFSPICDRLYPYRKLLICTDREIMYYGEGINSLKRLFSSEIAKGNIFHGGGDSGYLGTKIDCYNKIELEIMKDQIINEVKEVYSYHIFYFPFKWTIPGESNKSFEEQVDLSHIPINVNSAWHRVQLKKDENLAELNETELKERKELFGERQYFFEFIHPMMYDSSDDGKNIVAHYERKEPSNGNVHYHIYRPEKEYVLDVEGINLNLYSTGVGILSFYLANTTKEQDSEFAVREINQFGRRIMPPHCGEFDSTYRSLIAQRLSISGLRTDNPSRYDDKFNYTLCRKEKDEFDVNDTWTPSIIVTNLIKDLSNSLDVTPVIDDRMFVNCWYGNDDLAKEIIEKGEEFYKGEFWYQYVFVDDGKTDSKYTTTCKNDKMRGDLLMKSTNPRWQKLGTLYGITRYSIVALTDRTFYGKDIISMHMRTIYSRMFELAIIQNASLLRFSEEVVHVSDLKEKESKNNVAERIGSLYKEYIRFMNQAYFSNVTAQEQGIELYSMLLKQLNLESQVQELKNEISELYQYITLIIDQKRNRNGEYLNLLAAICLPATIIAGLFGMNKFNELCDFRCQLLIIVSISAIFLYFANCYFKKRK